MRNITVSVDEETHRLARIKAAELDTSGRPWCGLYLGPIATARGQERETVQDYCYAPARAAVARR